MTLSATPKLTAYALLGTAALLAALVVHDAAFAALGLPFLLAVLAGLALVERPDIDATARPPASRVLEGDEILLAADVRAARGVPWLQAAWQLPAGLSPAGDSVAAGARLRAGEARTLELRVRAVRWGAVSVAPPILRAHDQLGFFRFERRLAFAPDVVPVVRVYPRPERLRLALSAAETQAFSGNELARTPGDGIEFADVRPYAPGDRARRINWRLSTRAGSLHVNETHPERNTDVVLFLDEFSELRAGGEGTMDTAVRAAATLAQHYLGRRDRVGVVGFGGILRWLSPSMGTQQAYRIADVLIDSQVFASHVWRDVDVIPRRTLPPRSLVIALTPLLDRRIVAALLDLRARGYDVTVIELDPDRYIGPEPGELGELAHRLWRLDRDTVRLRYRQLDMPIVRWRPGEPLQRPLDEAQAFRRRARWLPA